MYQNVDKGAVTLDLAQRSGTDAGGRACRSIWEGETQGLCPRCQKPLDERPSVEAAVPSSLFEASVFAWTLRLVRAYQQLSKLCQTGRDFSLDALKLHFLERPILC